MRYFVRVLTAGLGACLLALPLAALGGGAQAATSHGLTVPAQVSASNWSVMPNPVTTTVTVPFTGRVSCVTSNFCMTVGPLGALVSLATPTGGYSQMWNGSTWSSVPLPSIPGATGVALGGVSCVTTSFCIAAGVVDTSGAETMLILQWNGTSWTVASNPPGEAALLGVSCTSVTSCTAVGDEASSGDQPIAVQLNGTAWSTTTLSVPTGVTDLLANDVSCTNAGICMATGSELTAANGVGASWFWNGSTWSLQTLPKGSAASANYQGISCVGASLCLAVGTGANSGGTTNTNLAAFWNGSGWSLDTSIPSPNTSVPQYLFGADCVSATYCTAVGGMTNNAFTTSEVLNWNGQSWSQPTTPGGSSGDGVLSGVSCLTNWACVAVGTTSPSDNGNYLPLNIVAPIARSGYRFVASDGGIFNYGPGAPFLGSMGGTHLNKPIVGMAVTPDGAGYWLVASDGGIFAFGDAVFYGSTGNLTLNKPVVGMATTPNGNGYYLVASDGGIFAFPSGPSGLPFYGSTGATTLNKPIVGLAVTPAGQYYLVASDGGIFAFPSGPGGPPFYGSTGALTLNKPVIGMSVANGGTGYYLGASDGGIFSFPSGNAGPTFYGSRGGQPLNKPIVGIAG